MNRILVTIGISGAGKSTWAHEMWSTNPQLYVIVNRDKIRELLFGLTEENISDLYWNSRKDIAKREKQVTQYQDTLIQEALATGKTPIVDATHLTKKYVQGFKYWNVPVELVWFDVKPDVAFSRANNRARKVELEVINKQYAQFKTLKKQYEENPDQFDFTPVTLEQNPELDPCVLVDIDGTLAHMTLRTPYDWHRVEEDEVDEATASLVRDLKKTDTRVIICTGRDGICLRHTENWLRFNNIPYDGIFIRAHKDQRPDWVVKEEMWRKIAKMFHIEYMVDDRQQVVRRARALGLKVMNVEYHNF